MPLQEIYYIAEMIVGVAVIIQIVFVAIELRQNTYMMRKSQGDQRRQHFNWLYDTLITDENFRQFHQRIDNSYDTMSDDEKFRSHALGVRNLRLMLDELVAYFEGNLSEDEFLLLRHTMEINAIRPNIKSAWDFVKPGYSQKVQRYWENLGQYDASQIYLRGEDHFARFVVS